LSADALNTFLATITHHGAIDGVTGSCHQLNTPIGDAVLVDCGLFQGTEVSGTGSHAEQLAIEFDIAQVRALVVTHVHIDHIGRIPYLLAAGFNGPIICSPASAQLLPLVLEDALKVGVTRDERLITAALERIRKQIVALPYKKWLTLMDGGKDRCSIKVKLSPAGHILGSAYVEFSLQQQKRKERVLFSGDLGSTHTPLLPAPKSPYQADILVLESTYGDRRHVGRFQRYQQLRHVIEVALRDRGTVLIPAFSIGRTQELLYELEQIIHQYRHKFAAQGLTWDDIEIIVDSPLAASFTQQYRELKKYWDREAQRKLKQGRHPLAFEQLITIADHKTHLQTLDYLAKTRRPAIVIAASGMCSGGRIVNYLKAMLGDSQHNVLFVGYQAIGTPGRAIQKYGPSGGYVDLAGERINIRAGVETISGYSAHADQEDLIRFVKRMRVKPKLIRLVHGDQEAKQALQAALRQRFAEIIIE